MKKIQTTLKLSDVDADEYQAIIFAGGHGAMWDFSRDKSIKEATKEVYEEGGIVGALCHGPAALVDVKLSDGNILLLAKKSLSFQTKKRKFVT